MLHYCWAGTFWPWFKIVSQRPISLYPIEYIFVLADGSYFWELLKVDVMTFSPMDIGINSCKVFEHTKSYGSMENGQSCHREIHGELHNISWRQTLSGSSQITVWHYQVNGRNAWPHTVRFTGWSRVSMVIHMCKPNYSELNFCLSLFWEFFPNFSSFRS